MALENITSAATGGWTVSIYTPSSLQEHVHQICHWTEHQPQNQTAFKSMLSYPTHLCCHRRVLLLQAQHLKVSPTLHKSSPPVVTHKGVLVHSLTPVLVLPVLFFATRPGLETIMRALPACNSYMVSGRSELRGQIGLCWCVGIRLSCHLQGRGGDCCGLFLWV